VDFKLLQKFYDNRCSKEELEQILSWFEDPGQKDSTLASIEMHWHKFEHDENEKEETINHLKERINYYLDKENHLPLVKSIDNKKRQRGSRNLGLAFKIASTILLVVAATYGVFNLISSQEESTVITEKPSVQSIIKMNPKGQKLKVMLKDGSVVTLNSDSKIIYNDAFGITNRNIQLEGEAFFEVEQNTGIPFVVSTKDINVAAVGTSFNVQDYPEKDHSFVALSEGKVSISRKADNDSLEAVSTILDPGEMIVYDKSAARLQAKSQFDYKRILGWRDGFLLFEKNDFQEVKTKLERWYGVEIMVKNEHWDEAWHYSGQYNNVSLENVLQGISFTKSFRYRIEGEKVYIEFK